MTGPPDVVHDLGATIFLECLADARGDRADHLVPRHSLPLAAAARTDAAHRVEDALRIGDLVQRRRALRAVAPARAGMMRVALELADRAVALVHPRDEAAGGFAVEADRRHELVVLLDAARPGLRIELDPVVPLLDRWKRRERRLAPGLASGGELVRAGGREILLHEMGCSWPERIQQIS